MTIVDVVTVRKDIGDFMVPLTSYLLLITYAPNLNIK